MPALNASLSSLLRGEIKPERRQLLRGREYFQFENGQIRRQIGQGHTVTERKARRRARKVLRSQVLDERIPVAHLAGYLVSQDFSKNRKPSISPDKEILKANHPGEIRGQKS